jgi:hypothetical protein
VRWGALCSETGATPDVEKCCLVFSMDGEGAYAADDMSIPSFSCCDTFGYVHSGCACGEAAEPAQWGTVKSL